MKTNKIHLIYFSATNTTKSLLKSIFEDKSNVEQHNITRGLDAELIFPEDELAVFGVPVYAGRVPSIAAETLQKIKGNGTPAIIVVVYGNRDYDDALLELKNIVASNNFKIIAAGAFVAEHAIFPQVANGRPDAEDKQKISDFAQKAISLLNNCDDLSSLPNISVKGNYPYKEAKSIPLKPRGNRRCNKCGACVKGCPAKAISEERPQKTNKELCISCARCIHICPQKARHFGGLLYKLAGKKFVSAYGKTRREPEVFFA